MASKGKTADEQAAIASLKELRARDAALATREYEQERQTIAARTEKLRALRLAREREVAMNPPPPPVAVRKTVLNKTALNKTTPNKATLKKPNDPLRNKG